MHDRPDLPPFEIVMVDDTSYGGAPRLRVRVALSPEDVDAIAPVALAVLERLGRDPDVMWMLFYYTADAAVAGLPPELRARYVRNDIPPHHRPQPMMTSRATAEIPTAHGVLTVELPWHADE